MAVRQTSYRRPVTPEGLRAIETDTLNWYSPELYANFNTGVLEEYLEERNRRDSFELCPWDWRAIMIGIVIGTVKSSFKVTGAALLPCRGEGKTIKPGP